MKSAAKTTGRTTHDLTCAKPTAPQDTIIQYMYRDAGNYKFYSEFCLSGILTLSEIKPYLIHSEYFIPNEIRLVSLVPEQMNDDDHLLHEFVSFSYSISAGHIMSKVEFIRLVKNAHTTGWFKGDISKSLRGY
ncbi:MAG: hypothetical protein ACSLFB_14500 [Acidimicrobiales bacterium]